MTSLRIYLKRIRDILLTAQFRTWKNIDAQSYGFFHCGRYLSLDTKYHLKQKPDCLNDKVIKKYKLNDENLEMLMNEYDVIAPHRALAQNNYNQYKKSKGHHIRDLDFCLDVIKNDYPEIYTSAQKYMKSKLAYFCNMFIMKKEIFSSYCTWLLTFWENTKRNLIVQIMRLTIIELMDFWQNDWQEYISPIEKV